MNHYSMQIRYAMKIIHIPFAILLMSTLHAQDTLTWNQFSKVKKITELIPSELVPQAFPNDNAVNNYSVHMQCPGQRDGIMREVFSYDRNVSGTRMDKKIFYIVRHFKNKYNSECTIAFDVFLIEKHAAKRLFEPVEFYIVVAAPKPQQEPDAVQPEDSEMNEMSFDTSYSNSTEFLEHNAAMLRESFGDFDTSGWHAQEDDRFLFEKFIHCFNRKHGHDTFINFVKAQHDGMTYNSILQKVTNYETYYRKTFRRFRYDWYTRSTTTVTDSTIREGYEFYKGAKMIRTVWLTFLEGSDFTGWDDKTNGDGLTTPKKMPLFAGDF